MDIFGNRSPFIVLDNFLLEWFTKVTQYLKNILSEDVKKINTNISNMEKIVNDVMGKIDSRISNLENEIVKKNE